MDAPLPTVAYAKNAAHERFLQSFEGELRGRHHKNFLVGVEYLGGRALRQAIEAELGNPQYSLNGMYPARDMIVIFDRAVRGGVSVERIGELTLPSYKRANPKAFEGKTVVEAFEMVERVVREDTTYGGVSPQMEATPGCVLLFRKDSPVPCQYFVGMVKGVLNIFGIQGSVREVACQWERARSCAVEARWAI